MKQHGTCGAARLFGLAHHVTIHTRWALVAAIGGGLLILAILWGRTGTSAVPPAAPDVVRTSTPPPAAIPEPPPTPEIPTGPPLTPLRAEDLPPVITDPRDDIERLAFELTNAVRARHGLPPLARDAALDAAARAHSQDMLQRGFFAHVDPDGRGPADRVSRISGLPTAAVGENIWMWSGSGQPALRQLAEQAVAAWAASPAHRENILRRGYTHLGIGAVIGAGDVRLTQLFRE
jgi:uncharacterized protein YkwD